MKSLLIFTALALGASFTAEAQIIWDQDPLGNAITHPITGPSDISTLGTAVDAIAPHSIALFGGGSQGSGSLAVNDTTFNIGNTSDAYFSVSNVFDGGDGQAPDGLNAYQQPSQQPTPPSDANSYNYDELLTHCTATGGTSTVSIDNLNPGTLYQIQIWNSTGRQTTYTSSLAAGSSSVILTGGDYALGNFLATGTTASFTFTASGNNGYGVISDIALRAAPEPSTYGALALGLVALVGVARFRRLSA